MLYTTIEQKELIRRIVDDYDNYKELGKKFVLRMILDITNNAALEWNVNDETTVLYNDNPDKILDFIGCIGLINFLLKNDLIYIQSQKDTSVDKFVVATNAMPASEVLKGIAEIKYCYIWNGKEVPAINENIFNTNICKLVDSLSNSLVYPMPFLVDYVNNDFKTEEQLRFEKQKEGTQKNHDQTMKTAYKTLNWTRWAFFAALASTLGTLGFELHDRFIEKDLSIRELNKTIEEYKIPAAITTKTENDTIKAIIVDQPIININKSTRLQRAE